MKPIPTTKMRPWNLGKFTGMTTDEAHDGILHHVENPDEAVPDGESFNTFKQRAAGGMLWAIKKAGGKKLLVVSHHRNERLFSSMNPDGSINAKKYMKTGEDPGDVTTFEFDTGELKRAAEARDAPAEAVGKVWETNSDLPASVKNSLPGAAQTVWRRVAMPGVRSHTTSISSPTCGTTKRNGYWRC